MPVRDGKVDETEERVERGAEQREEVPHGGDDFREDETEEPNRRHDAEPNAPSENRVAVRVPGLA